MIKEYKTFTTACDACEIENNVATISNSYGDGWHRVGDKDLCPLCFLKWVNSLEDKPEFTVHLDEFVKDAPIHPGHDLLLMGDYTTVTGLSYGQ